jgi:hypothetical protein
MIRMSFEAAAFLDQLSVKNPLGKIFGQIPAKYPGKRKGNNKVRINVLIIHDLMRRADPE